MPAPRRHSKYLQRLIATTAGMNLIDRNRILVRDTDEELRRLVPFPIDDCAHRRVLADKMEDLNRSAEAKMLRSSRPVTYHVELRSVTPVVTVGGFVRGLDEEESDTGLQVFWGDTFLGTIIPTEKEGVPCLRHRWSQNDGEAMRDWFLRLLGLDLDEQESSRVQWLIKCACWDLYQARR
jgi:hypothetical protein